MFLAQGHMDYATDRSCVVPKDVPHHHDACRFQCIVTNCYNRVPQSVTLCPIHETKRKTSGNRIRGSFIGGLLSVPSPTFTVTLS